jgi:hypothetical protein
MNLVILHLVMLALSSLAMAQPISPRCPRAEFQGEVEHGKGFEKLFGQDLLFRLHANEVGWTIEVRPKGSKNPEHEFSWVVTPPYRFWNPRYLEVSYGNSARDSVAMKERDFRFVLNAKDYERAATAVRILLWSYGHSEKEIKEAEETLNRTASCEGRLNILDSRISEEGKFGRIEWLKFEVQLGKAVAAPKNKRGGR